MSNNGGNTETRAKIKKQFDRYLKNSVSTTKGKPTQVSDQVARELFADFISSRCPTKTTEPRYEQTIATVGVNSGIFQGSVDSDMQPKYRDSMVKKLLASKGITGDQPVTDQIRFAQKEKAKMYQEVLQLAKATGETASMVIASPDDSGFGRHAGILTATQGADPGDINWTYVDIYRLMDYLTTYHAEVAFRYLREVQHSK